MRPLACALLLLLLVRSALAEGDARVVLDEARKAHLDLTARGLKSFTAEMTLLRHPDVNLRRYRHLAAFG